VVLSLVVVVVMVGAWEDESVVSVWMCFLFCGLVDWWEGESLVCGVWFSELR
jgi:hypothetical protein